MEIHSISRVIALVVWSIWFLPPLTGLGESSLIDEAKKEGKLVFYSTMTAEHHDKVVQAFHSKYPFIKIEGFRANPVRVVNRVLTEGRAGRPLVDVINVDELSGWVLREKGFLQPYKSKETDAFPEHFRDPEGFFPCCTYVITNSLGYNKKLVSKEEAPRTFQDLLLPKWKGKLGMESDLAKLFAALVPIWGKERTVNYFQALMKQQPSMRSGRTLLAQLMAAGEFSVGLGFYAYRILELQEKGLPLEIVQADPVVAWPWRLLLLRDARHPKSASLFIDYMLSEEGQRYLASLGRTVLRPGIKNKYPQLVEGVKLHLVRPDIGRDYETLSKAYYNIVNAR
ncbi:MAG: extracellular solute-binding protein [Deltaproteobacteria bacterium]|nr:extracellular solute-binding protein [Deltaproteobacteria bacterium]